MSESALQLLHGDALASAGDLCGDAFRLGVRPDPDIGLDEWSDRHRWISAEDSPREFGRWRTSRVPFTREIMQKLSANDPTREVVVMKGSQMALTMVLVNLCGYSIAAAPRSVILYEPTTELARQVSRRIDTMIEASPAIASRMLRNTALNKGYYGGQLRLRGAQSPVPFRNLSAPVVIFDDCDGMPGEVGSEGDPIILGTRRANNFPDRKIVKISTPTLDGSSRIKAAFLAGDQRYLHVPCPECGRKDFITWSGFRDFLGQKDSGHYWIEWKNDDPSTARLVCGNPDCKARIEEQRWKSWMLERHEWIPLKPENSAVAASYNLPALYSPDGWYSWADAVGEWIGTKGNPIARKGFVNTVLGEAWETKGQGAQESELQARREHLARGVVPYGAGLLTAAVDTHDDRLEVLVLAWGADEESWPVTFMQFLGNPSENAVWFELDAFLKTRFKHEMGSQLRIECAVVDSGGHHSDEVYQFCAARQARWVYAVRGGNETGRPIVERPTWTNSYRIPLFTLCTDTAKELIYGRLAIDLPKDGETAAGCIHLARWMDDEAMAQLAAEKGLWRYVPGKGYRRQWKQIRERNELLDLYVYNKSALDILRLHRGIDLAQLAAKYGEAPDGPPPPGPSEGSAVLPPRRRPAFRKTWMGRLKR